MWIESNTVLLWFESTTKHTIFIANRVCQRLELTSECNHVASSDKAADAGTLGMAAEVLQSNSRVEDLEFLKNQGILVRTKQ